MRTATCTHAVRSSSAGDIRATACIQISSPTRTAARARRRPLSRCSPVCCVQASFAQLHCTPLHAAAATARITMWRAALRLRHAAPCATLAALTRCDEDTLQKRTTWKASSDKLGPPRVHRIVITGGPCAGKTTAMAKLSLRLQNMGFDVFVVPEVATLTITGGAKPGNYTKKQHRDWEVSVLKIQMALEDNFRDIAEKCSLPEGRHAVLLMDRGTMDVLAYVGKDQFDDVLEEFNWTIPQLRDQRYEAVVHLVTAAIGAERFYTLENNKARMA